VANYLSETAKDVLAQTRQAVKQNVPVNYANQFQEQDCKPEGEITVSVNKIISGLCVLERVIADSEDKLTHVLTCASPEHETEEKRLVTRTRFGAELEKINDTLNGVIRRLEDINNRIDL
jgi:hypothetical protein